MLKLLKSATLLSSLLMTPMVFAALDPNVLHAIKIVKLNDTNCYSKKNAAGKTISNIYVAQVVDVNLCLRAADDQDDEPATYETAGPSYVVGCKVKGKMIYHGISKATVLTSNDDNMTKGEVAVLSNNEEVKAAIKGTFKLPGCLQGRIK